MTQKCPLWVAFLLWVLGIMVEQNFLQPHVIWLSEGRFHLQTQKHFIQNVKFKCIFKFLLWLCWISHVSSSVLYTVLHIHQEKMWERKNSCLCEWVVVHSLFAVTKHTNKNFSSLTFSLDVCAALYGALNWRHVKSIKVIAKIRKCI